jgi:hypothetical protein
MNDKYELARQLRELRGDKYDLEARVKALNAEIEDAQAELVGILVAEGSGGFNHDGYNIALVIKEQPSAEVDRKDDLYRVMREQGFEDLFSINTNTLSSTVKELMEGNDGQLPEWLDGLIRVHEKATIQIRKGRKV